MQLTDLSQPIEYKNICDWAFSHYINYKKQYPNVCEKDIAEVLFRSEYLKVCTTKRENISTDISVYDIESIPDLIYAVLCIEFDKSVIEMAEIYTCAMLYSINNYFKLVPKDSQDSHFITLAKVYWHVSNEVDKMIKEEDLRSKNTFAIFMGLMTLKLYKSYDTDEKLLEAIHKMII